MTTRISWLIAVICLVSISPAAFGPTTLDRSGETSATYFPESGEKWETIKPDEAGVNEKLLQQALDFAGSKNSNGVLVLWRGRIVTEQYWNG